MTNPIEQPWHLPKPTEQCLYKEVDMNNAITELGRIHSTYGLVGHIALEEPIGRYTETEIVHINLAWRGHTPAEIAKLRNVELTTVRSHQRSILRKTGVSSMISALPLLYMRGVIPQTPEQLLETSVFDFSPSIGVI